MAADVSSLTRAMGLEQYAALGHSYGAFVVLQHAVDFPGDAAQTIVSSGIPSARYLEQIDRNLAAFEPIELREQVTKLLGSGEARPNPEGESAQLLHDQWPFQFADPHDPRIEDYERRTAKSIYSHRRAQALRLGRIRRDRGRGLPWGRYPTGAGTCRAPRQDVFGRGGAGHRRGRVARGARGV